MTHTTFHLSEAVLETSQVVVSHFARNNYVKQLAAGVLATDYSWEFSGTAQKAYRIALIPGEKNRQELHRIFANDGLGPSTVPNGCENQNPEGQSLLSRILETALSRGSLKAKRAREAKVRRLAAVIKIFVDAGFNGRAGNGLVGARVLATLLLIRPVSDCFIDSIKALLDAGANPSLPVLPIPLDHQASCLDFAQGCFAVTYEKRESNPHDVIVWFTIYRLLLAASRHEAYAGIDCRIPENPCLKSVSLIPKDLAEKELFSLHQSSNYRPDSAFLFQGTVRFQFTDFSIFVSAWTGEWADFSLGNAPMPNEINLNEAFKDCIGKTMNRMSRGYLDLEKQQENRCDLEFDKKRRFLDLQFENGKVIRFTERVQFFMNPFADAMGFVSLVNASDAI